MALPPSAANVLAAHHTSTIARGYTRRQPETTMLYSVVRNHLPHLLDRARDRVAPGSLVTDGVTREDTVYLVPHGAADTRTFWRSAVNYHVKRRAFGVALHVNGSTLTGTWNDLARSSSTLSVGLALTIDIDGLRGVRTPL
ncbi:MAG: hypothetical protein IAG13_33530 [Deltaproteobacteria bacterium]|nr:hypothetical protein [Nannocystaceae bacterium]